MTGEIAKLESIIAEYEAKEKHHQAAVDLVARQQRTIDHLSDQIVRLTWEVHAAQQWSAAWESMAKVDPQEWAAKWKAVAKAEWQLAKSLTRQLNGLLLRIAEQERSEEGDR